MICKPTPAGGRLVTGDTPHGSFRFETDKDNSLISWSMDSSTPAEPRPVPIMPGQTVQPRRIARPGDWLSACVYVATFGAVDPCRACRGRRSRLNSAGWRRAWKLIIKPSFWRRRGAHPGV